MRGRHSARENYFRGAIPRRNLNSKLCNEAAARLLTIARRCRAMQRFLERNIRQWAVRDRWSFVAPDEFLGRRTRARELIVRRNEGTRGSVIVDLNYIIYP